MKHDGLIPLASAAVIDKHFEWIKSYANIDVDLIGKKNPYLKVKSWKKL